MLSMMNGCPRWSFLTVPLLAALGCSDPVPLPAKGDATLSVQQPPTGAATCPVPGKTYVVAKKKGPNTTDAGDRFIDGEDGATIKCSVKGGGPFTFSATIRALSTESAPVTLTLTSGVINADKLTGSATLAVNTPELANTYTSAVGACTIGVVGGNVKAGSLWATISCPLITDSSTGKGCSIGTITTVVLENCEGS
jgi:hypothetical protein